MPGPKAGPQIRPEIRPEPGDDIAGGHHGTEQEALRSFAARYCEVAPERVALSCESLEGGLESVVVTRADAHILAPRGAEDSDDSEDGRDGARESRERHCGQRRMAFVAKRIEGDPSREADVYESVVQPRAAWAAPALLGVDRLAAPSGQASCRLYLEWVQPLQYWPWKQSRQIQRVLELLARLHAVPSNAGPEADSEADPGEPEVHAVLGSWDYEAELAASAHSALRVLEQTRHPDFARPRRSLPALRRVVAALPAMRRHLLGAAPLGTAILHGDVHSGNVLLRKQGGEERPLLIDWARARIGSPLEDVSSWLQSLGYWEPQARRLHDTLLAGYLAARGLRASRMDRALRDAYWLASASNILAGALVYYLNIAVHAHTPREREGALHAIDDGLRIIRRADVCWRRTSLRGSQDGAGRRRPSASPSHPPSKSRSGWRWQAGNSSTGQG